MSSNKTDNVSVQVSETDFPDSATEQEIETEAEMLQITQEFQENVINYVKYDDLIRKKMNEIKELKKQRKPREDYILKYLADEEIKCIEVNNGKLRRNKSETKVSLNKDIITEAIRKKISDPAVIKEIFNLMDARPTKVRFNLKRTMLRKKRDKKK